VQIKSTAEICLSF